MCMVVLLLSMLVVLVGSFSVERCKYKSKFAIESNQDASALCLCLVIKKGHYSYWSLHYGVGDSA